jgi:hypothetical protein
LVSGAGSISLGIQTTSQGVAVTARLIDDHTFVLTGEELVQAYVIISVAIKLLSDRNGGAAPTPSWLPELRRGANITRARFADETRTRTLAVIEAESAPEGDRDQEMTAVEAARLIGITEQYCRRVRHKIGVLREKPITFDRQMVEAYALAHPRSRRSAA